MFTCVRYIQTQRNSTVRTKWDQKQTSRPSPKQIWNNIIQSINSINESGVYYAPIQKSTLALKGASQLEKEDGRQKQVKTGDKPIYAIVKIILYTVLHMSISSVTQ